MGPAGHNRHTPATNRGESVVIAAPSPLPARSDGVHHLTLEHVRKRLPPKMGERERQHIDAHIVELPIFARIAQAAVTALGRRAGPRRHGTVPIDAVGNAPELAPPFAGESKQVPPGNVLVGIFGKFLKRHDLADTTVERGDQPFSQRKTSHCRERSFSHAEGDVGTLGRSP